MSGAPAKSLATLHVLRSKIFETTHNPTNARNGGKYLRKSLVGPAMLRYYPPQLNLKTLREAVPAIGPLMLPEEKQRLQDVERKKMLGKGPPKKGEGRRATMKGKKK
ncbi:mitochondral 37S ribosomal protein S27 [Malassezia psittaci]|uniref:Small ribosomal subunit protein mS33 n=1 Tax=Malassezia psittaci TaxID=1821823 RepID=A0AAF0JD07_9BASI|nr:mitochondral 37S ribosomal protein S27 [Malassezia psittaci]